MPGWAVFCLVALYFLMCVFLRFVTRIATMTMITRRIMIAKNSGEDIKFATPGEAFVVDVSTMGVSVGILGVAVVVICVHHWFIEDGSKADK